MHTLIACFGNVLRGDDGFGPAVAERLSLNPLPAEVRVLDAGIGGIHMVHELLEPVELLIVVDAVSLGRPPGTLVVIRPQVLDIDAMSGAERLDALADMHYATPERALMLAGALGVLPTAIWMIGCEAFDAERVGLGLSPLVAAAVGPAAREICRMLEEPLITPGSADPASRG